MESEKKKEKEEYKQKSRKARKTKRRKGTVKKNENLKWFHLLHWSVAAFLSSPLVGGAASDGAASPSCPGVVLLSLVVLPYPPSFWVVLLSFPASLGV